MLLGMHTGVSEITALTSITMQLSQILLLHIKGEVVSELTRADFDKPLSCVNDIACRRSSSQSCPRELLVLGSCVSVSSLVTADISSYTSGMTV